MLTSCEAIPFYPLIMITSITRLQQSNFRSPLGSRSINLPKQNKRFATKVVTLEETRQSKFQNAVTAGNHKFISDEPGTFEGGKDAGSD